MGRATEKAGVVEVWADMVRIGRNGDREKLVWRGRGTEERADWRKAARQARVYTTRSQTSGSDASVQMPCGTSQSLTSTAGHLYHIDCQCDNAIQLF